jgi:hypothetical protein
VCDAVGAATVDSEGNKEVNYIGCCLTVRAEYSHVQKINVHGILVILYDGNAAEGLCRCPEASEEGWVGALIENTARALEDWRAAGRVCLIVQISHLV